MRHYKSEEKVVKQKVLSKTTCDICGVKKGEGTWRENSFERNEVTITHDFGTHYPECGHGYKLDLDICSGCFKNKILPFLKSISTDTLEYNEYDW